MGAGFPILPPGSAQQPATQGTGPRPPQPGYLADPEAKQRIQLVNDRINFTTRESTRWAIERQTFEVISFLCGVQWIEYSESQRRFTRWEAPSWFPTPVTNLMAPRQQLMQSALLRSEPQGRVRPVSNEGSDREAARVAEQLITHFYSVTDEDCLRHRAAAIASMTGTVIAEDYWNAQAGRILRIPRMQSQDVQAEAPAAVCPTCEYKAEPERVGLPCPGCGGGPLAEGTMPRMLPDGTPAMETQEIPETDLLTGEPIVDEFHEGEIESRVRMLFNFYWDPKATSLKEARWCGEAVYCDLDWIDQNFPEFGPFVAAEEGIEGLNFYEASLQAIVGPSIQGTAHHGGTMHFKNGAVLRKYQEKPSVKFPRGRFIIIANHVELYSGDLPLQDENGNPTGDFTYTEFKYDEIPGRFPGRTPCEDMVPLQKRVNGIDSQIILNRKTLLNPWVLAPKGSGLEPGKVAMRPGATVTYNFVGVGAAPQVVQGVPLPAQVMDERQMAIQAMDALAQDAAATAQAAMPAGVKSGIALNFIREHQLELQIPRLKRWGLWIAERDRKRLLLAQQHYQEPRAVKILGAGSEWQIRYWKGSDLNGNTDVSIDPGSLIPRSQSIQTQLLFDAAEIGLLDITDPLDREKMIEALPLHGYTTKVGPDRRRAQKENAQMDEGEQVMVNDFDDHVIHLGEHSARCKDPSFDSLDPMAQQLHLTHMQMHAQIVQQQEEAQRQQELKDMAVRAKLAPKGVESSGGPPKAKASANGAAAA